MTNTAKMFPSVPTMHIVSGITESITIREASEISPLLSVDGRLTVI